MWSQGTDGTAARHRVVRPIPKPGSGSSRRRVGAVDPAGPPSALPPVGARVGAFVAVLLGGLGGGIIGHAYASLTCPGGACVTSRGLWLLAGATIGAVGLAVIATLTLRALGEWQTTREADQPLRRRP